MDFYTNIKKYGNALLVRGVENGKHVSEKVFFQPTLYTAGSGSGFKDIYGGGLKSHHFSNMREANDFMNANRGYDIHGNLNYIAQWVSENFNGDIAYNDDLIRTQIIDIEVDSIGFPDPFEAKHEVTAVTVYDSIFKKYYVWGQHKNISFDITKIKNDELKKRVNEIEYQECTDETHLLKSLVSFLGGKHHADIISGWNSDGFDIPYLVNRIQNVLGGKWVNKLSPWNMIKEQKRKNAIGDEEIYYEICGISSLDYLRLFKKFGYYIYGTQSSYKLGDIGEVVVGRSKIEFDGSLHDLYINDFQTYIEYNIMDVMLVNDIEDRASLLKLATSMAYMAGANFVDVLGTVGIWDSFINKKLYEQNVIVPPKKPVVSRNEKFDGAFVKEVTAGLYEWVCSFDINSLYPSIIMQWNMSPETIVDIPLPNVDYARTVTNQHFKKNKQGFIPKMVTDLYADRVRFKGEAIKWKGVLQKDKQNNEANRLFSTMSIKEKAVKIFLNSLYGAMGNEYFRYYRLEIAEAITGMGQYIIKNVIKDVNTYLTKLVGEEKDYVISSDTDSVVGDTWIYVNGKKIKIEDFYDSVSEFELNDVQHQNFVKPTENFTTRAFDVNKRSVVNAPIKYVMKHRVKKEMFKFTVNGKSVTVTEDHSVIVFRHSTNEFLSVKPTEIEYTDFLIFTEFQYCLASQIFTVESLGVQDIDVYDIEVDEHHNFFANDILVHNSVYITIKDILKDLNCVDEKKVDIADNICKRIEVQAIQKTFDKIYTDFSCFEPKLVMKREAIASRGVWTAKKHYILNVLDNEGVRYKKPELKVVGIESIKSSTPKACKIAMNDLFKIIMGGSEKEAQKFIEDFRVNFYALEPHEKAFPRGVGGVKKYTLSDGTLNTELTIPINSRSAVLYNLMCNRLNLSLQRITDGDRMYYIYLSKKNPTHENVIGFLDKLPLEFGLHKFVDNNTQFEKSFVQPMKIIFDAIGWKIEHKDDLSEFF